MRLEACNTYALITAPTPSSASLASMLLRKITWGGGIYLSTYDVSFILSIDLLKIIRLYIGVHFGLFIFDVIYFLFISSLTALQNKSYL